MPTYAEYEALRGLVRERVQGDLRRHMPNLLLAPISALARGTAQAWPMPPRTVDWDWTRITKRKRGGDLELAIWDKEVLCGLAYGHEKSGWLELSWLEGNPLGHPLQGKIMDVALAALRLQGELLGLQETRLKNPFEELRDAYSRRGWSDLAEVGGTVYLCRREP